MSIILGKCTGRGQKSSLQKPIGAQPLRQDQVQGLEDPSLLGHGSGDSTECQLATVDRFQEDVPDLYARQLPYDCGWRLG